MMKKPLLYRAIAAQYVDRMFGQTKTVKTRKTIPTGAVRVRVS